MPTILFEGDPAELEVYGDVHVALTTKDDTTINLSACKVVRIRPPGKYSLIELFKHTVASIYPDAQVGRIYVRDPELPIGVEDEASIVNIPGNVRQHIVPPVDPD